MRIVVGYVPLESDLGVPLLSQNRQFQWFSKPTYVYPMVPASAATLLKSRGHEVLWLDGIAEGLTQAQFDERFAAFRPDLFLLHLAQGRPPQGARPGLHDRPLRRPRHRLPRGDAG